MRTTPTSHRNSLVVSGSLTRCKEEEDNTNESQWLIDGLRLVVDEGREGYWHHLFSADMPNNYGCPIAHLLFPVYEFHFNLIDMISRIPRYLSFIPRYLGFIPRYLSCILQYVLVLKEFPDIDVLSLPSHCDDVTFAISALLAGVVLAFLGTWPSAICIWWQLQYTWVVSGSIFLFFYFYILHPTPYRAVGDFIRFEASDSDTLSVIF